MGNLSFAYPTEYILLCLAGGTLYSYLMYSRKGPWSLWINRGLSVLRALVATFILILLLSPVLRQIQNRTESPQLILAVDDSRSIAEVYDSTQIDAFLGTVDALKDEFTALGYEPVLVTSEGVIDDVADLTFSKELTNLDDFLQGIRNDYEGRNLSDVVLLSDGIVNSGVLPTYRNYPFQLSVLGLGDSTAKSDLAIDELTYNKIAYQGNKFPLRVRITQYGYDDATVPVSVFSGGKTLATEQVTFNGDGIVEVDFQLEADGNGVRRYSVVLPEQEGEYISENNRSDAYIEIIEGRQKIVIVAASPHPDVSAMVEVLEQNPNYEISQFILSIPEDRASFEVYNAPTDLFILHQLPSNRVAVNWRERFSDQSLLMLYGPQMDLIQMAELFPYLEIETYPGEFDEVFGVMNQGYAPFTFSDELQAMLTEFPPLITPFGEFTQRTDLDVLLSQRVGSITTSKPLLATKEEEAKKVGLLLGSGLWQWKLTDYARNKENTLFNEFLTNLVQYLTTRADKRKFRFYPIRDEYNRGEEVIFQAEVYNELYERVYGNKIDLRLIHDEGEQSYTYVTSEENSRYIVSGLSEGVYRYEATAVINGSAESVTGEFVVRDLALETLRLTADFALMRELADRNGGAFYAWEDRAEFLQRFGEKEAQGVIYSQEKYLSAINLFWLFLLLLVLVSTEWAVRKYHGSY